MEHPLGSDLALREPLEPLFVVGQMGLGYEESRDMLVLVVQELAEEEEEPSRRWVVRLWATRGQMAALSEHIEQVAGRGRPICPLCKQPIDAEGHFCPKSNGHGQKVGME